MNLEALKELAANVEAGECQNDGSMFRAFGDRWTICFDAYNGSLDAAKAMHDAVLPGWDWSILSGIEGDLVGVGVARETFEPQHHGADFNDNPARAWLLAILRALIAQEESK